MFKVKLITTGEIFTVYGITGVHFMIWDHEDKSWRLVGIENFEPLEECHMDKNEMKLKLMQSFPGSFFIPNGEFIAHKKSNTYLVFTNCETLKDLQCKILEWFSRSACKTEPFHTFMSNEKFHRFMLDGVNDFLGTDFTFDDMELIYTYLGNACNHALTVKFVESGYDMDILRKRWRDETCSK